MYKKTISFVGLFAILAGLGFSQTPVAAEEPLKNTVSNYTEFAKAMMFREAQAKGYLADSVKLDFKTPASIVMRLYKISEGKSKLVQSTKPTGPSTSFEVGFMFRPAKKGGKEVSFIFDDLIIRTKQMGTHLRNEQAEPHWIPMKKYLSMTAMGIRKEGEKVIHSTSTKSNRFEYTPSLKETAALVMDGYVITATLKHHREQGLADQPDTAPKSESKGSEKSKP